MDEEDDKDELAGAPQDILSQLAVLQGDQAKQQERARAFRQQQLQQALETIKQRRYGPSISEQLFALSAAFAQPTRHRGLGSVLANVMPVLAETAAARRQGKTAQEDTLLDLQNKYTAAGFEDENDALRNRAAMLKVAASVSKPPKRRTGINPVDGLLYDLDTGEEIPLRRGGEGGAAPPVLTPEEARKAPPGTLFKTQDGRIMRVPGGKGGPTGSPLSGGF
jgi:hypothetical protein